MRADAVCAGHQMMYKMETYKRIKIGFIYFILLLPIFIVDNHIRDTNIILLPNNAYHCNWMRTTG